jgi:hypothetical protein
MKRTGRGQIKETRVHNVLQRYWFTAVHLSYSLAAERISYGALPLSHHTDDDNNNNNTTKPHTCEKRVRARFGLERIWAEQVGQRAGDSYDTLVHKEMDFFWPPRGDGTCTVFA